MLTTRHMVSLPRAARDASDASASAEPALNGLNPLVARHTVLVDRAPPRPAQAHHRRRRRRRTRTHSGATGREAMHAIHAALLCVLHLLPPRASYSPRASCASRAGAAPRPCARASSEWSPACRIRHCRRRRVSSALRCGPSRTSSDSCAGTAPPNASAQRPAPPYAHAQLPASPQARAPRPSARSHARAQFGTASTNGASMHTRS